MGPVMSYFLYFFALLCSKAREADSPYLPLAKAAPSRHVDRMGSAVLGLFG